MRIAQIAVIVLLSTIAVIAQAPPPASPAQAPAPQPVASKGCLAVFDAGSHAFRNIMLGGLAGALVSKKQYKVADAVGYPAKIGQKFHGNDLQTLQQGGTRIVILDKKYSADELHMACR